MRLREKARQIFAAAKAAAAGTAPLEPVVGKAEPMDRWLVPVGTKFSVEDLKGYLRLANSGDPRLLSAFYSEMRATDGHIDAELRKAESLLTQRPVDVTPFPASAEGVDEDVAEEVAAYVREQLTDPDVRLGRAVKALFAGLWGVVAGVQVVVEPGAGPDGKEKLRALDPVLPERFAYLPNTNVLAVQRTPWLTDLVAVDDLGASLVIVAGEDYVASPARRGLMRRCLVPWLVRRNGVDWWARFVELFGLPLRLAKIRPGDAEAQALLEEQFEAQGTSTHIIAPDTVDIQFVNGIDASGSTTHADIIGHAERTISKVVLGATQTTEIQPNAGSKQSADTHMEVVEAFVEAYAQDICEALRRMLLRPLVARNFGDDVAAKHTPVLSIRVRRNGDLKVFGEGVAVLKAAGMRIPVGWCHERTGIPWAAEGEECLGDGAQTPPAVQIPPGEAPAAPVDEAGELEGDEGSGVTPPAMPDRRDEFAARRAGAAPAHSAALDALEVKAVRLGRGAGEALVAPYRDLIDQAVKENLDASTLAVRVLHRARSSPAPTRPLADLLAAVELEAIAAGIQDVRRETV